MALIDPSLDIHEEMFESIALITELAVHCTVKETSQRPNMGQDVNVLAPLVETWKLFVDDTKEHFGICYSLPFI